MTQPNIKEGLIVGFGISLVDIIAICNDGDFLEKYDLKEDGVIKGEEKHKEIYNEIKSRFEVVHVPGGSSLNTVRVIQWIVKKPNVTSYFGSIGDDENGKWLLQKSITDGVNMRPQVMSDQSTGTCVCLINGTKRTLIANFNSANHFSVEHVTKNWEVIEKAEYYFVVGFFFLVSPETIFEVSKHANHNNKCFMMSLAAPYICERFTDLMKKCLPYLDIIFGNEAEARAFSKHQNLKADSIKELAVKISQLYKVNSNRNRIVVFTQGCNPTIVAQDGNVSEYPVFPIKQEDIIDTTGAGDAFVGGFLSQFMDGKDISECVRVGHYAANYIIQQRGTTFNHESNPPLSL